MELYARDALVRVDQLPPAALRPPFGIDCGHLGTGRSHHQTGRHIQPGRHSQERGGVENGKGNRIPKHHRLQRQVLRENQAGRYVENE